MNIEQERFMDAFDNDDSGEELDDVSMDEESSEEAVTEEANSISEPCTRSPHKLCRNAEKVKCQKCPRYLRPNRGFVLSNCRHVFCRNCLIEAITNPFNGHIFCPYTDDMAYPCGREIHDEDVVGILEVDEDDDIEDYNGKSFECFTQGCGRYFIVEEDSTEVDFWCPDCHVVNCINCQAIHMNQTCEEYWAYVELIRDIADTREYLDLMYATTDSFIPNRKKFDCPICFDTIEAQEGVTLYECTDSFCRECLAQTIEHCEDAQVRCPGDKGCKCLLEQREIKGLITPEAYERHLDRCLKLAENSANTFHCQTPDCKGFTFIEEDDENVGIFPCQLCNQQNCIPCRAIHRGMDCAAYQMAELRNSNNPEQKATAKYLEDVLRRGLAMRCPKCNMIVEKDKGCDGMTCTVCRTDLCWATKGARWGPGGKGDTSGGCRCDYRNQRPCTPNCRNCH